MHPVLFQIGSVTIYTYGVLAAAGFLAGLWYAYHRAPIVGLDPNQVWNLGIWGILVALAVSKIWLILSVWDYYSANPRQIFSIATFQSAGVFYGGLVGGLLWVILYTHSQKMSLLAVLDLMAAPVALGHAIGRLGCFAAGCCYGKPTSVGWGVTFTNPVTEKISGTPLDVSLHPTQLYESAAEFLNFAILVLLGAKRRTTGRIIGAYFILYGIERGTIEFFRGDPGRTLLFHNRLSLMQIVSAALIITGAGLWLRGHKAAASIGPATRTRTAVGRS
ncbi:MAG TPA: prolipoprotein diacylglyceryl transferase [Candidatus Cybelea sp.]|jgi:phosphatidylglycerol---prolipoprotein diacylglyceryl transferase|nr:prolipoprotein diacylglyceryl transferase [Candidatus Cybelea sp.]